MYATTHLFTCKFAFLLQINGSWEIGYVACVFWISLDVLLSVGSIFHLAAIAIHRFCAIVFPLKLRKVRTRVQLLSLIVTSWCCGLIPALGLTIMAARKKEAVILPLPDGCVMCIILDPQFLAGGTATFFVPLLVMICVDSASAILLRKRHKLSAARIAPMGEERSVITSPNVINGDPLTTDAPPTFIKEDSFTDTPPTINTGDQTSDFPNSASAGKANNSAIIKSSTRTKEERAARTLIWVLICFVVFWLPFFTTILISGVCSQCNVPAIYYDAFTWLGYASSGVNPCIYAFTNKDFRKAFKKIVCRRF